MSGSETESQVRPENLRTEIALRLSTGLPSLPTFAHADSQSTTKEPEALASARSVGQQREQSWSQLLGPAPASDTKAWGQLPNAHPQAARETLGPARLWYVPLRVLSTNAPMWGFGSAPADRSSSSRPAVCSRGGRPLSTREAASQRSATTSTERGPYLSAGAN